MGNRIYEVVVTAAAERDLESIYDYIAEFDGASHAEHVLDELVALVEELSQFPERGSYPKELADLGIREFRQALFKPYRVIYALRRQQVIVYLITDGRRDLQALLSRRLFDT